MPKLAYHGTFRCNMHSIIRDGLIPGGVAADGSASRYFVMMSPIPAWQRENHAGVREDADIAFVIDLQLAALEGVRIFRSKADAIQTPDWISNRFRLPG